MILYQNLARWHRRSFPFKTNNNVTHLLIRESAVCCFLFFVFLLFFCLFACVSCALSYVEKYGQSEKVMLFVFLLFHLLSFFSLYMRIFALSYVEKCGQSEKVVHTKEGEQSPISTTTSVFSSSYKKDTKSMLRSAGALQHMTIVVFVCWFAKCIFCSGNNLFFCSTMHASHIKWAYSL